MHMKDLVFGLLDCCYVLLLLLPLFGQQIDNVVYQVPVWALTGTQPYLRVIYIILTLILLAYGVALLALQNYQCIFWQKHKAGLSLLLGLMPLCMFVLSRQPYAALFSIVLLALKTVLLIKKA